MTDFQSALGFMQLKRYKKIYREERIVRRYISKLKNLKILIFQNFPQKDHILFFRFYAKEEMNCSNF